MQISYKFILPKGLFLCMLALFINSGLIRAEVSLPGIFSDNMVLQQKDNVDIWGKTAKHKVVTISTSWNSKTYRSKSDNEGNFRIKVSTPQAGGPYTVTLDDGDKRVLKNILIGEVWVCSGQSNMEMPVKGFKNQPILNSTDILLEADHPQIRLIRYERALTRTAQFDCKSTSWEVSNIKSAGDFSAVGYQFAQILQRKLKVPVGVIMSTWGGTKIEAWMTERSLKEFPEIRTPLISDPAPVVKNDPAVLFNAMIHPFLGYGIKGVIWYQGEANRSNSEIYDRLMISMVKGWRSSWNRGDFPFYYVQIAPFKYDEVSKPASLLREAQLKASKQIPNSGMVVTMDIGEENFIHAADKTTVSKRLGYLAMANAYGMKGLPHASPIYKSMELNKDVVKLTFEHAANGLTSFGKKLSAFEVAGEDKIFYPATARILGPGITLQSDHVKVPVAVRYAFKNWVVGNVFNTEGFPLSPFRTDSW